MQLIKKIFDSVLIIEPQLFKDNRGCFFESYRFDKLKQLGITSQFKQDNQSFSRATNTLRGMHFQLEPMPQAKLVRVIRGAIKNYVIDIRINSPFYKQYDSVTLTQENRYMLYIPAGFANGFVTLQPDTEVLYKVDNYYSPEHDRAFRYDDPEIGIKWNIDNPVLSERDSRAPLFSEVENNLFYKGEK